jgi:recombination protein RecT
MGRKEVQFQVGYKGLLALARRSGEISTITAEVVHANDTFAYQLGDEPMIDHKPSLEDEPGEPIFVYAIAKLKDGGIQRVVMTRGAIEKIRTRSKAGSSGPWVTDWEEMAKKTAIKRLCKLLPMSIELADAIATDTEAELDTTPSTNIKDVPAEVVDTEAPKSRNSAKARAATAKVAQQEPVVQAEPVEPESASARPSEYLDFFANLSDQHPEMFAKVIAKAAEADQNFMGVKTMDDLERFDEQDLAFLMAQYQIVKGK